ncbi:nitroreductase [Alloalcanivorax gelatiniphagus]|uniref:Nitroreductase n=1 Tax=Alloalcanivorax gelatiniphagus TaxID=1194167 RepID=A0ABY2XPJ9_9GAMM|nr:nitroreductase [Alloalcanivorax gelatiniphagus]TMW14525.1 nitroreductase [Alloalcanivorax gelatiniphagus]
MEFIDVLNARHSVRAFTGQAVPEAVLRRLLERAAGSPSWSNTQPYQVAVATGPVLEDLRQQLSSRFERLAPLQNAPAWKKALAVLRRDRGLPDGDFRPVQRYPDDLQPRRVATGRGLYELLGIGRKDHQARHRQMAANFRFFDAPAALFLFTHRGLGVYSVLDAGIYLQTLMLAAVDEGLGSCAQGALGLWRSPLERHFEIPSHYQLLCGLSLGYPDLGAPINRFRPEKLPAASLTLARRGGPGGD